ncbi:MAG: alpha/beta fold hydrolase [Anaerolineales bacterium]
MLAQNFQDSSQPLTALAGVNLADRPAHRPAPQVSYHRIQLPKTNLHYISCGSGPPLVIVPATISKIENWLALAQFMGQRFTVYFFELPGHGKSSPFKEPFSSQLAAETVEDFIDQLGHATVSLMGFSFGGILAMTTLYRLRGRVEKVILLSPVLSRRALKFSALRLQLLRGMVRAFRVPRFRSSIMRSARSASINRLLAGTIAKIGRVEKSVSIPEVFQKISDSTADVLCSQLTEMLNFEIQAQTFAQPCYFAMSVRDPMLCFDTTLGIMQQAFPLLQVQRFQFPYHQPPKTPTFEEMNQLYAGLLDTVCST